MEHFGCILHGLALGGSGANLVGWSKECLLGLLKSRILDGIRACLHVDTVELHYGLWGDWLGVTVRSSLHSHNLSSGLMGLWVAFGELLLHGGVVLHVVGQVNASWDGAS